LPGGELIDRIQNIAGNVADRQYLNSRRLSPWTNSSGIPTTSYPQIRLSPPFPAISAASAVIVLLIFIYFVHISHLFIRERRREVSKKVQKNFGNIDLDRLGQAFVDKNFVFKDDSGRANYRWTQSG
jgi:hypothetical protein